MRSALAALRIWAPATETKAPRLPDTALHGEAFLEAVVQEVHELSTDIAVSLSVLDYYARTGDVRVLKKGRDFLPRTSSIAPLSLHMDAIEGPINTAAKHLEGLTAELHRPIQNYEGLLVPNEFGAGSFAAKRRQDMCIAGWRILAALAIDAINQVEPLTRWRLSGLYGENALVLVKALNAARAGDTPCIGSDGHIARPFLPQRRRAPRFALRQPCRIRHAGVASPAFAQDISRGGIGLSNAPPMPLKAAVEVLLNDRAPLSGMVVWASGGRTGIQFLEQLSPLDPLVR